jgi:hypothetical protein
MQQREIKETQQIRRTVLKENASKTCSIPFWLQLPVLLLPLLLPLLGLLD